MPISHYSFSGLPFVEKKWRLVAEGTFLIQQWNGEYCIELYHMASNFFCEAYFHCTPQAHTLLHLRTFTSVHYLTDHYAGLISLKDLASPAG